MRRVKRIASLIVPRRKTSATRTLKEKPDQTMKRNQVKMPAIRNRLAPALALQALAHRRLALRRHVPSRLPQNLSPPRAFFRHLYLVSLASLSLLCPCPLSLLPKDALSNNPRRHLCQLPKAALLLPNRPSHPATPLLSPQHSCQSSHTQTSRRLSELRNVFSLAPL